MNAQTGVFSYISDMAIFFVPVLSAALEIIRFVTTFA
jgi:hypothetical protein